MKSAPDWEVLRALFEAALRRPPAERSEFLRNHTAGDEATQREVESLLAAHGEAADFLTGAAGGPGCEDESILDQPRLTSGIRLGPFEIGERLGSGGMGEIYRARDTRLDRFVAIKVLSGQLEIASRARQRFEREARAISKLSHPHIGALYDVGTASVEGRELLFLVLELLDGETLAATLARGALSIADALTYAIDIADALATAHAQGIVHRDLKPSNVMVTKSGVKLLDFGLAQLRAPDGADEVTVTSDVPLTSVGMVFGTAPYMSPEQVEGRKVDARSDIFSFGSLLYEMLAGQRAFAGKADRSATARILSDDPKPVNELGRSIPTELGKIVSQCLRKNPGRRYQHIADVRVALEDVRDALDSSGAPKSRTRRGRQWVAMLLVITGTVALGYVSSRRRSPDIPAPRIVPLTTLQGSEASPTLAPDGEHVAFTWSGPDQDNDDIYVQRIGSGSELRRTTHPARDFGPAWSPDGRWIAFLRGEIPGRSELRVVPPLGGPERLLGEIYIQQSYIFPPYLSWFPDSSALVVVDCPAPQKAESLFVIFEQTGEKRPLTAPQTSGSADTSPAVSPDGRSVVFQRGLGLSVLAVGDDFSAKSEPKALAAKDPDAHFPAWTADSKEIIYSAGGSLWRVGVSSQRRLERLPFGAQDAFMPVLSRSSDKPGRLVYVRSTSDSNLWRLDLPAIGTPPAARPFPSIASTMLDANPQFSPDGKRIAFQSTRSGSIEIWAADPNGANAQQLTTMNAQNTGTPRWSPDGKTIAFDSNAAGQYDIYVVPARGGRPKRITFELADDHVPSFSKDGSSLYFSSTRSGVMEIWKQPLSGGEAAQVTHNGGVVAFESFDGRDLYYTQASTGSSALWRTPTAGGGTPQTVVDDVAERAFVVLEKGIYYMEHRQRGTWPWGLRSGLGFLMSEQRTRLRYLDFAQTTSRVVADLGGWTAIGLGVSPDGRTVLYTRVDNLSSDLMMVENFR